MKLIGKSHDGSEIIYPDRTPCLVDIVGTYSYLSWEGDILGDQWIVRLYNTASTLKAEKAFGAWADRATLNYLYI
jgi:hypothetical protein